MRALIIRNYENEERNVVKHDLQRNDAGSIKLLTWSSQQTSSQSDRQLVAVRPRLDSFLINVLHSPRLFIMILLTSRGGVQYILFMRLGVSQI